MLNTSLITHAVSWGIGRHIYYLTPEETVNAIKFEFIAQVRCTNSLTRYLSLTIRYSQTPGIVAPTLARISFAIYLLKFVGTSKFRRWILWSVVWSQAIVNIIQLILIFAQCEHFAALWDPSVGGKCWSRKVQVYSGYFLGGRFLQLRPFAARVADRYSFKLHPRSHINIPPASHLKGPEHNSAREGYPRPSNGNEYFVSTNSLTLLHVYTLTIQSAFAASIVKTIELGNLGKVSDFTCTFLTLTCFA